MQLYVYCITGSGERNSWLFPGGYEVRNLPCREIGAAVGELFFAPGELGPDQVLRHEEVIESIMAGVAVLPMRFGTVLEGEKAALALLQERYATFRQNLDQVEGMVEMGLKIIGPATNEAPFSAGEEADPPWRRELTAPSPGTRYLRRRWRELAGERQAQSLVEPIHASLAALARAHCHRFLPTPRLLLDAAYLVPRELQDRFADRVQALKETHPGLKFMASGPWPPYSFVLAHPPGGETNGR